MAPSDKYRRIADRARAIPARFGLREYTVEAWVTEYSGAFPGSGASVISKTPLTVGNGVPPKVRFPSQQEIAVGGASIGQAFVGPLTPDYGSGGVMRSLLDGSTLETGQMLQIYVIGPAYPTGCLFREHQFNVDRALRLQLVLMQAEPLKPELP